MSLIVLLQYVPGDLLVQDMAASSSDSVICPPVLLSIGDCHCQYHYTFVLFSSSVCYHLYIFLSICVSSPLFFFLPHSFSPSPSLMSAFIRCVNNCLPTVVIAPPCQLEVWSKWQCAQFSLACIVQFLVSLVPIAKKKSPHYSCVLSVLLISEPVNMFTFHLDFLVCPWNILLFMCCGRIYCLG